MKSAELANAAEYPKDHDLLKREIDRILSDSQRQQNILKVQEFFANNLPSPKPAGPRRRTRAK